MQYPAPFNKGIEEYGNVKSPLPQPEWNVSDNGKGLLSGTLKMYYEHKTGGKNTTIPPKRGDKHPYDERLICSNSQINFGSNNIAYCDATYVGLVQDPSEVEWELSCTTEEDPIQTHPNFLKRGEGMFDIVTEDVSDDKPIKWDSDQVLFDYTKGGIQRFKDSKKARDKDLTGITAFKAPRSNFKITFHTLAVPTWAWVVQNLGYQTGAIPMGPEWTSVVVFNKTWLLISSSVTEYGGGIYKVTCEFMLSGIGEDGKGKPWNKIVYRTMEK